MLYFLTYVRMLLSIQREIDDIDLQPVAMTFPDSAGWLPTAKSRPPEIRADMVARPVLLADLQQAVTSHPLVLLSAPAGYGKTTLLTILVQSIAAREQSARQSADFAWLSIDEADNDPIRFMRSLVAALAQQRPDFGAAVEQHLQDTGFNIEAGSHERFVRRLLGVLVNAMDALLPDPYLLVLDDLHLVQTSDVLAALDYLLSNLPANMRIVVAARSDPPPSLARLRARGQLAEFRLGQLRFSRAEIDTFLNQMHQMGLSLDELDALDGRVEGWPVGLRLLAISLAQSPAAARGNLISHLSQADRHVFDFLAEEVLNQQPADVRAFILQAAVLSELTPEACRAVTGRDDAATVLETLYRRNLFLVAMESSSRAAEQQVGVPAPRVYRFHALFAVFLREQLHRDDAEQYREMQRRAAGTVSDASAAINHYLAAEAWQAAMDAIEARAETLVQQGLVDTLQGWIERLPAQLQSEHPQFHYWLGICAFRRGDLLRARELLQQAHSAFAALDDAAGETRALANLAVCLIYVDADAAGPIVSSALELPLPAATRVLLLMSRATKATFMDRVTLEQSVPEFEAARQIVADSQDPDVLYAMAYSLDLNCAVLPGAMDYIEPFIQKAEPLLGTPPSSAWAHWRICGVDASRRPWQAMNAS